MLMTHRLLIQGWVLSSPSVLLMKHALPHLACAEAEASRANPARLKNYCTTHPEAQGLTIPGMMCRRCCR